MFNRYFHKGIAVVLAAVMSFSLVGAEIYGITTNADTIDGFIGADIVYDPVDPTDSEETKDEEQDKDTEKDTDEEGKEEATSTPTPRPTPPPIEEKEFDITLNTGVEGFVNRLYSVCLGRPADKDGFNMWCNYLASGRYSGAKAARGFILSDELTAKNYTDEEFVECLYSVFFDREPDPDGFNMWIKLLKKGKTREYVMYGFVDSAEWANVCLGFGIKSGGLGIASVADEPEDGVKTFVLSLYADCLGRMPDGAGYRDWYDQLIALEATGIEVAYGFFYSDEFINKIAQMEPSDVVRIYYKVFLNRGAEDWEVESWAERYFWFGPNDLFNGFANSQEFSNKCEKYGIMVGEPADMPIPDFDEDFIHFMESEQEGINNLNKETNLEPHRTYYMYNVQGSETRETEKNISDKDWECIEKFAEEHFQDSWSNGQKIAFTMYWIHYNVDYASSSAHWSEIGELGPAQAIFEKRAGQCAQYNGAMCEMLCYLGYDANMIQGFRGSSSSSRSQHFWCEVTINDTIYVIEAGNKKDGDWWYLAVPYSQTRKFIKNGVVQG